jgi:hypothetical protein
MCDLCAIRVQSGGISGDFSQLIAINGKKKAPFGASKCLIYSQIATFTN